MMSVIFSKANLSSIKKKLMLKILVELIEFLLLFFDANHIVYRFEVDILL